MARHFSTFRRRDRQVRTEFNHPMSAGFGVDQKIDTDNRYIEQAGYFLRFTDEISALGFRTFDDGSPRMIIRCQTYLDNLALARHTVVI